MKSEFELIRCLKLTYVMSVLVKAVLIGIVISPAESLSRGLYLGLLLLGRGLAGFGAILGATFGSLSQSLRIVEVVLTDFIHHRRLVSTGIGAVIIAKACIS